MSSHVHPGVRLAGSEIRPPCHTDAFFHSQDEEHEVLLPFIREGLERGDKSFPVIDDRRRQEHPRRPAGAGVSAGAARDGQSEVRGWETAHFQPGWFDKHAMLARVDEVLSGAKPQGFPHTRWMADMNWALGNKPGVEDLAADGSRLTRVAPKHHATVVCTHDLAKFSAAQVVDVFRGHPFAVLVGVLQQNLFSLPPAEGAGGPGGPGPKASVC